MLLIVVDSHSKWIEVKVVKVVKNATSLVTMEHFRTMFATHGLPKMLVTDNGTPFVSKEIEVFYKQNGIRHVRSAPYHPATNGLAERAVQSVKSFLKKETRGSLQTRVSQFLLRHRITPHTVTGVSPSELLMGHRIRSRLDLLLPNLPAKVLKKQTDQVAGRNKETNRRTFSIGDLVSSRDLPKRKSWLPGTVISVSGSQLEIRLTDGRLFRRHIDDVLHRSEPDFSRDIDTENSEWLGVPTAIDPRKQRRW